MAWTKIEIAKDFSDTPGGRHKTLGPWSGEAFRDILVAKLTAGDSLEIILDGAEGYPSSFLEEAFGGLIRLKRWNIDELSQRMRIVAVDESYKFYVEQISRYMSNAAATINGQ